VISNRSVPANILLPHLVYEDVTEAIEWLTQKFGFSEHYRYGEPAQGAQMHLGNAWIMLRTAWPGSATPAQSGIGTQSLTVFVDDVDTHYKREYGEHQYGVEDLAGHHWLFSRHARDVNPEEWGAKVSNPAAA
jgi:uncharacterized glyoxalase superfamily protein PhnB